MKGRYQLYPDRGYVDITIEGRVTMSEMSAFIQTLWADPGWTPEYNGLMDFSGASIDLSDKEILDMTGAMKSDPHCSFGRWVFVVSRASDFAKLRKIDQQNDEATILVFFDRASAEKAGLQRTLR
jgi:hypothetical protein